MICESFGIPPDVALRQDPRVVIPIMEYRMAEGAKVKFNAKKGEDMVEAEVQLWMEMAHLLEERQPDFELPKMIVTED